MAEKWYDNGILDEEEQKMPQIIPIKDLKNTSAIEDLAQDFFLQFKQQIICLCH